MKKVLLSALAVSVMFVSCNDKENSEVKSQEIALSKTFEKVYDIQQNMYKKSSDELVSIFNSFKSDVSSNAHADLTGWIENIKVETPATKGNAGYLEYTKDGEVKKRYLNEHGIENGQLLKKGLIGALQFNQALKYGKDFAKSGLSKAKQEELLKGFSTALLGSYAAIDNEKEKLESHGKEFMGYRPINGNEFAKYVNVVNNDDDFSGISDDLYNSLKEAKKNLGNQALVTANVMKALKTAQKIVAIRGVHYLKEGSKLDRENLNDGVAHAISEGLGFLYSLQYTYNYTGGHKPYLTRDEVTEFIENLDLWDGDNSAAKLVKLSKEIAEKFNFDWNKA